MYLMKYVYISIFLKIKTKVSVFRNKIDLLETNLSDCNFFLKEYGIIFGCLLGICTCTLMNKAIKARRNLS